MPPLLLAVQLRFVLPLQEGRFFLLQGLVLLILAGVGLGQSLDGVADGSFPPVALVEVLPQFVNGIA